MFEKTKETFTLLGVLLRLLATLRGIAKSLASLADSQALTLKLAVLQSGGSIEELRGELIPSTLDTVDEDSGDLTDEELAANERIELEARAKGREMDEAADPTAVIKAWLELKESNAEEKTR
jgi:hypothetical protein